MFTKICVFLLLGSAFATANPVQNIRENELAINDVKIGGLFDRVTMPFKKMIQLVVETGEGVMDYSKEKFEQLMLKYYEIKSKSESSVNEVKNQFILKVVGELQNVIKVLSKQADAETLEQLKQKTQEIAESSKKSLEELQYHFQEAIELEKKKLDQNLDQWKQEADKASKRHT